MKTLLAVTLAVSSTLGVLLGVINDNPQQAYAQTIKNNSLHEGETELGAEFLGTKKFNSPTFPQAKNGYTANENQFTITASPYQIGNTYVTGTYSGTDLSAITKVMLLVDGVIVKNGAFNQTTNTFQIHASSLVTSVSQKVEVALFSGNTELKRAAVSVSVPPVNDYVVTPSPYQIGSTTVTGTYSGTNLDKITKVVLLVDGVIVKNGTFNQTAKTFQISAGGLVTDIYRKVEVALFDGNKELKRAPVSIVSDYNLAVSPYQLGNASIIGTYSGTNLNYITKVALLIDGVAVKDGTLNMATKTFQIPTSGLIKDVNQKVEVALFAGNMEVKRATVSIIGSNNLIASPYQIGHSYVTGTYSGTDADSITKIVLLIDGVIVKNGSFNATERTFQIYAGGLITSNKQKVEVAMFMGNQELKRTSVPVSSYGDYNLTASPHKIGNTYVTGTYSGTSLDAITKIVLLVDGIIVKNGAFNHTTKTFQIYASNLITSDAKKVEVAIFGDNTELKRATVTINAK
ncbi:immunoglobulin-like domain-containing protein [Listeria grandensis]|uniref:immunoglobulin-like domain-containing protein n=1 Tax=Listeria grandensis TaxID=1494963 RepID=UPI00164D56D6|nr:immunoglobulin-like domain-containing protein [Listeria grandensis]MBC6316680.1 hypothetical protein [Listeria grandensis]